MAAQSTESPAPPHAVRCLKREGGRAVWLIQRPGEGPRTLKVWPLTAGMLLKVALGISQPQRQVRGARRLERAGIATPRVCRRCSLSSSPGSPALNLELDHVEGASLHTIMHKPEHVPTAPCEARAIAAAVGDLLASLASRRVFHRDFKPSNVVVERPAPSAPVRLWLIDPVGVRSMRDLERDLVRMLTTFFRGLPRSGAMPLAEERRLRAIVLRRALRGLNRGSRRSVTRQLRQARQQERRSRP